MISRFKGSLGYIKSMMDEDTYHTVHRTDFENRFVEPFESSDSVVDNHRRFPPVIFDNGSFKAPNLLLDRFCNNLYPSFLFIYEIELILEQILYDGLTLNRAESLMDLCCFLSVNSSNVLMDIDDEFSYEKKYSLAKDVHILSKSIYDLVRFRVCTSDDISRDDKLEITSYDEIDNRLCCKYISNGIAVLKLFHVLALIYISPLYPDGVHQIAKELIQQLREILYDKRIIKMVVDTDTHGMNDKAHKTTRLKIFFAMTNSDRYCIRLDFPHIGEDSIHLNINEPGHKQSSGLPFHGEEYEEARRICKDRELFRKLFYYRDDLFWFRSGFASVLKDICRDNEEMGKELTEFYHNRAHVTISSSEKENMDAVIAFSNAFAEIMVEYDGTFSYEPTDLEDENFYRYMTFQDDIFDIVIRIKSHVMNNANSVTEDLSLFWKNTLKVDSELDAEIKRCFCEYIESKFPQDDELILYTQQDTNLCDFLSRCLDRVDQVCTPSNAI